MANDQLKLAAYSSSQPLPQLGLGAPAEENNGDSRTMPRVAEPHYGSGWLLDGRLLS